jgi:phosphoadenosine phosphosulfate reductase
MADNDLLGALNAAAAKGLDSFVREALARFGGDLRVASSFGVEDMVIVDAVADASRELGVVPEIFLLDTGRLHQETFDLVERVRDKYALPISLYAPRAEAIESLVKEQGPNGFYRSVEARKACCHVRKVEPLGRALSGARAWLTGLRRDQAVTRTDIAPVEIDDAHGGILKLSPLFDWTEEQTWARARAKNIPTHALHAQGFASIGCAPCTRAIQPGEHARAGRWWWESPEHKECGLHSPRRPQRGAER